MSLMRSQWISLVAATTATVAAIMQWSAQPIPDRSHWLAITITAIAGVLWFTAVQLLIIAEIKRCHEETRTRNEELVQGMAECVAAAVTIQMTAWLCDEIAEQRDRAEELDAASNHWQKKLASEHTLVDLQRWRAGRTADAAP